MSFDRKNGSVYFAVVAQILMSANNNWVIGRFFGEKGDRYVDIFNNSFMRYRSLSC